MPITRIWNRTGGDRGLRELADLIDRAADAILVRDASGSVLRWNDGATALYGWSAEESRRGKVHDLLHTRFPISCEDTEGALERDGRWEGELVQIHRDGTPLIIESRQLLMRFAAGSTARVLEINRNITHRRRAELDLHKSEARFRRLFESNLIGIACGEISGRIVDANDAFLFIIGYSREDLRAGRVTADRINPAGERGRVAQAFAEIRDRGVCQPYEKHYIRKDGSLVTVLWGAALLEGSSTEVLGFVVDLTERESARQALETSEQRFRATFDQANIGIAHVGLDGRWLRFNRKLVEILGYSEQELRQLTFQDVTHPDDLAADLAQVQRLLAGEIESYSMEKRYLRPGGEPVWANLRVALLRSASGEPQYFISVVEDISQRRKLEEHLRQQQRLESIGRLAGGVAHDFNNLLTGILGNIDLAMQTLPPFRPEHEPLRDAAASGQRVAVLTRQLLAFAGKGRFVRRAADLREIVNNMVSLTRPSIGNHVRIEPDLDSGVPPIEGDEGQLQQLVTNLLFNAAEAIAAPSPGTIRVAVRVEQVTAEALHAHPCVDEINPGRYVVLEVADSGSGMDEATLAEIFDPFFTTKFTGRGLGLAASLGIVRQHRGAIQVISTPGKGTAFRVLLPITAP